MVGSWSETTKFTASQHSNVDTSRQEPPCQVFRNRNSGSLAAQLVLASNRGPLATSEWDSNGSLRKLTLRVSESIVLCSYSVLKRDRGRRHSN
jgi:hypothetical protein